MIPLPAPIFPIRCCPPRHPIARLRSINLAHISLTHLHPQNMQATTALSVMVRLIAPRTTNSTQQSSPTSSCVYEPPDLSLALCSHLGCCWLSLSAMSSPTPPPCILSLVLLSPLLLLWLLNPAPAAPSPPHSSPRDSHAASVTTPHARLMTLPDGGNRRYLK